MSRSKATRRSAKARTPPVTETAPAKTGTSPATASPRKTGTLDKLNIFFAVFGAIAIVAGLLTHALLIIVLLGLAYVGTFAIIAIYERSIKWSAWRVIIALILVSGVLFIQYIPPKTESFGVYVPNDFTGWNVTKPPLYYFPISDDPQTGRQYSNYQLDAGSPYEVNARCWVAGHLFGNSHIDVDWVSIKGGSYDGLWLPFEAVAMSSPGLARDLPNCNSWWFKVWPF